MALRTSAIALAIGLAIIPATAALAKDPPPAAGKAERKFDLSEKARPAIVALQTAVNAKDAANIPAKLAAAQAVSKTADDRYIVAKLQYQAASDANDAAAKSAAIEAIAASGGADATETQQINLMLAQTYYNAKADDKALAALAKVTQTDPNNSDALMMTAQIKDRQGNSAEALAALQKAISLRTAAGQKADESWYKRSWSIAYERKLPSAYQLTRDWVTAYPSPDNWHNALAVYINNSGMDDTQLLDVFRLERANGSIASSGEYYRYASAALTRGYPGEAKAVLDEGIASGKVDRNAAAIKEVHTIATTKSAGDRASLAASAKTAMAAATAKSATSVGDAYYGYGDYALAVPLYRAALTKTGADANTVNLHLGMALARSGDKAGATAALNAVTGPQAEVAKYWLLYNAQH